MTDSLTDRYTDLSFALGNKLLGILDEKQHRDVRAIKYRVVSQDRFCYQGCYRRRGI